MGVKAVIKFECDGCFATAEQAAVRIEGFFESFSGRSWGFGTNKIKWPEFNPPPGWVTHDPYTHACYCPSCWKEIIE